MTYFSRILPITILSLTWLGLASVIALPVSVVHAAETATSSKSIIPNDPYWDRQWYLRQMGLPEAWTVTTGTSAVTVAVIDTRIDIEHPDLKENIWRNLKEVPGDGLDNDRDGYIDNVNGWNFVNNSPNVQPFAVRHQSMEAWSHGTLVASLIGARGQNNTGIAGVNWNVKIMPLVVLDAEGEGSLEGLLEAIRYAVNHGASIINLSLAGFDYDEQLDQLLRRVAQANVLVVSATGNDTKTKQGLDIEKTPVYPACMDGSINAVLGVSGTDTLDQKAPYANHGKRCTDVAAPALEIFGARPTLQYDEDDRPEHPGYLEGMTGTSLAAPLVSGVASLIKSIQPTWTAQQILKRIMETADAVDGSSPSVLGRLGAGRINAARALNGLGPVIKPAIAPQTATSTKAIIKKKAVKKATTFKR